MTTTEPAEPSPRPAASGSDDASDATDAPPASARADEAGRSPRDERELTPEEQQRRAERLAARKEKRRAERQARRRAEKLAAREAQWEEAMAKAKANPPDPAAPRVREGSPSGRAPIAVYRATGTGLPPLRQYLHQLRKRRGLIWHLARSALKGENYNTFFGQIWLVLNPLLLAGVYILGRSVIRPMGSPAERNFLICHLVAGVFLFQFTAKSMTSGSRSIIGNKAMLMNTSFPRAVFPLSTTVRSIFDLIPLMITLLVVRMIFDQPTTWVYVFLPFVIGIQLLFNMGLAFATSTLMVFFRDFGNMLTFSTRLWLWTTPVLYTTDEIPDSIRWVLELNPLYPLFAMYEQIWVGEVPSLGYALWALAWAIPVFVFGVVIFLMKERDFAVRL